MKTRLTREELDLLWSANSATKGTEEYMKYHMECSGKHLTRDGKWSNWKFVGWHIPVSDHEKIKKVRDKVYILVDVLDEVIERFEITPEVNELLSIY